MRMAITRRGRVETIVEGRGKSGKEGVQESGSGKGDKGYFLVLSSGPPLPKMFTGLYCVKWVANAVTSMQTTSKHNSLIRSGHTAFVTAQSAGSNQVTKLEYVRCALQEEVTKREIDK